MPKKTSSKNDKIEAEKRKNRGLTTAAADLFLQKYGVVLQYGPNPTPFLAKLERVLGQTEEYFGRKRSWIWAILQG